MTSLPAPVDPHDEAAASPPEQPKLNHVDGVSQRGEPAIIMGEGDEDWMYLSDEWIEAERWVIHNVENMR